MQMSQFQLPFTTQYFCQTGQCDHCGGLSIDFRYTHYFQSQWVSVSHATYSWMQVITEQVPGWKPSHETLMKVAKPYFTLNTDHLNQIADQCRISHEILLEQYEKMDPQFDRTCQRFLDQCSDSYLLSILDDIVSSEIEYVNNQVANQQDLKLGLEIYPYRFLRMGIILPHNLSQVGLDDYQSLCKVYGLPINASHEIFLSQVIHEYRQHLLNLSNVLPEMMDHPMIHHLLQHINQYPKYPKHHVVPANPTAPINIPQPHQSNPSSLVFIPPHLLRESTGFTPPNQRKSLSF
uniref:Uncharacterized protein n=1 Tax=viral metagenome TaxID=1070528 RepID=A0A6C0BLX7_9ZZZZ